LNNINKESKTFQPWVSPVYPSSFFFRRCIVGIFKSKQQRQGHQRHRRQHSRTKNRHDQQQHPKK
jgi:hypothetical protein